MPFSLQVHKPIKRDGTVRGMRVRPYVRLSQNHEVVQIQDGLFYSGGSKELVGPVPDWVQDRIDAMAPEVRAELKVQSRKEQSKTED